MRRIGWTTAPEPVGGGVLNELGDNSRGQFLDMSAAVDLIEWAGLDNKGYNEASWRLNKQIIRDYGRKVLQRDAFLINIYSINNYTYPPPFFCVQS